MTQFTKSVNSSANDGFQQTNGACDTNANYSYSIYPWTGFRFPSVTIPQGAFIGSAVIETYSSKSSYPTGRYTIYGQLATNGATFSTTTNDLSSRSRTTANVSHSLSNVTNATFVASPDVRAVVQEIVNQSGWASGNALVTLWAGDATVTPGYWHAMFDTTGSTSQSARITIDYYAGAQGSTPASITVTANVGTPTISTPLTVGVSGIAVPASVGTPTVTVGFAPQTTSPAAIAIPVVIGTASVASSLTTSPAAIAVPVVLGIASIASSAYTATPASITVSVILGTATTSLLPSSRNLLWTAKPPITRWETRTIARRWDAEQPTSRWDARPVVRA